AYRVLRRVEHRLQMVADRQTNTLPKEPEALRRFALFMGYADADAFATALLKHLGRVQTSYVSVFEQVPESPADAEGPVLDFRGVDPSPAETIATLGEMGFRNPVAIVAAVRSWQAGRVRALRSQRS